jgi:FkbM family methyltransferase
MWGGGGQGGGGKDWTRFFDIERGDTVVDIGAHTGEFTKLASEKAGETGEVIAVEPEPENVYLLKENTGHLQNVQIIEAAIMDYNGEGTLHLNPENPMGHSMFESIVGAGERARGQEVYATDEVRVDAMTLDKICLKNNIKHIDFLKIDIEGGEIAALKGAEEMLDNTDKLVVEAYHPKKGEEMDGEKTYPVVDDILSQNVFTTEVTDDEWVFAQRQN